MRFRQRRTRRRHQLQVTHQPIYLSRLSADFSGLRLVQLSDIHHGLYTRLDEVERAVELANRLEPDLVALTGDFVTNSPNYIAPVARALGRLRAGLGCFAVLGNHDHRVGANRVAWALEAHGIEVLRNRHVRLRRNGSSLTVAGVDDFSYGADDLRRALRGAIADTPTILLSHNPALLLQAAACGVDLVLSGHTHGGQVDAPRLRSFIGRRGLQVPLRFRHGWEQSGATQLYISRGIGTVVLPIRLRCPAEIPVLTLQGNGHAT
ncbi:MAG: metallophosphoesterase [Acidobacteria bacterium]|nr:metallophosphoesterase [Acidobacteriota bacterium]